MRFQIPTWPSCIPDQIYQDFGSNRPLWDFLEAEPEFSKSSHPKIIQSTMFSMFFLKKRKKIFYFTNFADDDYIKLILPRKNHKNIFIVYKRMNNYDFRA